MKNDLFIQRDGVITTRLQRVKQVLEQPVAQVEEKPKRKSKKRKVITGVPLDVVENVLPENTEDNIKE